MKLFNMLNYYPDEDDEDYNFAKDAIKYNLINIFVFGTLVSASVISIFSLVAFSYWPAIFPAIFGLHIIFSLLKK